MEMTAKQLKRLLACIGQTQVGMARKLGISGRNMRRYVAGELPVPRVVQIAVRCLAEHSTQRRSRRAHSRGTSNCEGKQ